MAIESLFGEENDDRDMRGPKHESIWTPPYEASEYQPIERVDDILGVGQCEKCCEKKLPLVTLRFVIRFGNLIGAQQYFEGASHRDLKDHRTIY